MHSQDTVQSPFSIIVGPQVTRVDLALPPEHIMIGMMFRPGALQLLLGIPMTELFDRYVDSSLIWPEEIRQLEEQMAETDNYDAMICLAEQFLKQQYNSKRIWLHPVDHVFQLMLNPAKNLSIDRLSDLACMSTRQFDRKFYERLGLSPKVFLRIVRFSAAYRMKDKNPAETWLSIALQCGYYDFRHMLRDFKEFSDTTPTSLLQQDSVTDMKIYAFTSLM